MVRRAAAALLLTLAAPPLAAAPGEAEVPITGPEGPNAALRERPPSVPGDAALVAAGAVFGEISIRAIDIFDTSIPEEDIWPFRFANKIHPKTRERTIRNELLFRPGDPYDPHAIEESERLLRGARFLYDAWIRPVAFDGERVDVEVTTRDVWTLTVGVGFSRSGGENRTRIGIEDSNFLGTGKELTIRRDRSVDREETRYQYRDDNLVGSRVRIELAYSDNSDGSERLLDVSRPFFSLDTRWGASGRFLDEDRVDALWEGGQVVARFRHRFETGTLWAGFSRGIESGRSVRWLAGFTREKSRFAPEPGETSPALFPPDRTLSYPWLAVEIVPDAFVRGRDLDRIVRTEDLRLGFGGVGRVGWSSSAFGGDRSRILLEGRIRYAAIPNEASLMILDGSASGRYADGNAEDLLATARARYYHRDFGRHVLFLRIEAAAAHRLDPDRQLLLGGDSGLRGFPLRFQSGDRRVLATVEQRFYTDWHLFRLVHVGAAAFVDVGRAWFAGRDDLERPWLADVGVGLRLGSSRSARGAMVHIDFAWALDAPAGVRRTQIVVETRETF